MGPVIKICRFVCSSRFGGSSKFKSSSRHLIDSDIVPLFACVPGDKLVGEVSRLVVAEACIQALNIDFTEGQIYEINSVPGDGPGSDTEKWKELFKAAQLQ
ncbi:hypothetical protein R6Q57_010145 [Mikania cordata]